MTTKEFLRRCDYYSVLDKCAAIFFVFPDIDFCYKLEIVFGSNKLFEYKVSLTDFSLSYYKSVDFLYITKLSFSEFKIQLGYFKSFYTRLSNYQRELLKSKCVCNNLLRFLDDCTE